MAVALKENELEFLRNDGTVVAKKRSWVRQRFEDPDSKARVLLLTTQMGGLALNFTAANLLYIISPEWTAAAESQLEFRIHRVGRKQKTEIFRIYANHSIYERFKSLQELKMSKEWGILDTMTLVFWLKRLGANWKK
ncbi:hypothetical protein BPAE_0025g00030 [Botrytis paeoniae]|uniref:Helicase C-terminal domain-containing protein n=1 Tax=Botrytis paeoniae TaxID=278948 RepID=A0A4Z1FUV3_9HELO|nr:hypothetical protein BPAE_0025g00030 [Botrytis paeoniae]